MSSLESFVDEIFEVDGVLSQRLKTFEYRAPQHEYAKAVARTVLEKKDLIIEAGTGTGKGFSYIVPTIYYAKKYRRKIVLATANIALQEQLANKDLPFLKKHLPINFEFGLVKGRGNYLCQRKLKKMETATFQYVDTPIQKEIEEWAKKTETGDKSELESEPPFSVWSLYSSSSEECVNCAAYKDTCFAKLARSRLGTFDVIVCNYHLLLSHAVVRVETENATILPDFDVLVCDEGHKIADIARSFFGWEISEPSLKKLRGEYFGALSKLRKHENKTTEAILSEENRSIKDLEDAGKQLKEVEECFFQNITKFYGDERNSKRVYVPGLIQTADLALNLLSLGDSLKILAKCLSSVGKSDESAVCHKLKVRTHKIVAQIDDFKGLQDENAVYYVERGGKTRFLRVVKRMIDVSDLLQQHVYDHTSSTILTSATLSSGGTFTFTQAEAGLKEASTLVVASPFDYLSQCLLIVSSKAPNPKEPATYTKQVCEDLEFIINEANGRTLGLFTSYKNLHAAANYLKKHLNGDYTLLVQGDAPRGKLIKQFEKDVTSVLLGTESFWAGIDIPGEALSCVVIDRIPFRSPGDPVWDEMCRRSKNWFAQLAIPAAAIQLKQGTGRLIRSKTDKGVIVILDNRMALKGYGGLFIRSLPPMQRADTISDTIRPFLQRS